MDIRPKPPNLHVGGVDAAAVVPSLTAEVFDAAASRRGTAARVSMMPRRVCFWVKIHASVLTWMSVTLTFDRMTLVW